MRKLLTKKKLRLLGKLLSISMPVLLMLKTPAYSQSNDEQQWWFNVELIVFKRTLGPSNNENFDQAQFELNTAKANNLLYLAALKQASLDKALSYALPACNDKQSNGLFAPKLDFEIAPGIANVASSKINNDEPEGSPAANETRLSEDEEDYLVDLNVSNKTLMTTLLIPFAIEREINEGEIDKVANTLENLEDPRPITDTFLRQTRLNDLNNSVVLLNQAIRQNKEKQSQLTCLITKPQEPEIIQSALSNIGPFLFSNTSFFNGASQIITSAESFMQDYAEKVFKQRDIQALLYTAWRQKVEFGAENAEFYNVRAGNLLKSFESLNYEKWQQQYEVDKIKSPQEEDETFFQDLKADLALNAKIDWLAKESASLNKLDTIFETQQKYELEGQLKVFLDYVNQVPYLHIDTEFKHYRLEIDNEQNGVLQSFPLKQRRRVISKQIHYFDHPAFGLIVRLERFTPPLIEEVLSESTNN